MRKRKLKILMQRIKRNKRIIGFVFGRNLEIIYCFMVGCLASMAFCPARIFPERIFAISFCMN